ncbi:restriction endonuclease subunit S [Emticicia sp. 21SJ11W-3]|uniref:restriction endonuclease subunit S n=1 Tax=Emticicia sp. 21SJ11W-3 TaxID=2916755 RepID=UPI00209FCB46|nr:restriction endonuclease subunit S [Emticicia sp. 21SJ11W-3]UTA66515.1 restriction endonuclease subunit S [Emticicia sp. 21SJ11W-3]
MQTYTSYKPSNIEWIGEIPSHWRIIPLKYFSIITLGKMLTIDDKGGFVLKPYLRSQNIQNEKVDVSDVKQMWFSERELQLYLLRKNDLLINEGGDVGRTCIWNDELNECYIQNSVNRVSIINGLSQYFLYHSICHYFTGYYDSSVNRVSIPHLTKEKLQNILFVLPPIQEQQAIVNYLDHKTALIDELIIKKERKIELLKEQRSALINHVVTKGLNPDAPMKDSGIDWIGEIPEHWERKKIKQISKIISKGTTPSTVGRELLDEGEVRYLKAENISDNKVMLFPSFFIDNETDKILSRSKLLENDILVVIAGATLGKVAILTKEFIPANTNQAVSFIRLKENHNVKYIWYWLSSSILQQQIWIDAVQSAQPNLSMENLGNFCFTFPPLFEQKDIVKFLDNQTTIIDKSIEIETQKIEKLKEYRQSLISNVVTGKIKVF